MRRSFLQTVIPPFFVLFSIVFFTGCFTAQKATNQSKPSVPSVSLKKENAYTLMTKLKNNLNYRWLNAHFSADITTDSSEVSFNGIIRMRKDSIMWMTVSVALGAYVALHAKMGIDSVMYIDHHNEQYFKGTYDYLDTLLKEDIDFDLVQSVMVGKSLEFYHDTAKMRAYFDGKDYILSTIRKGKYRRLMYKNKPLHSRNDAQLIWLDDSDFHIKKIRLEDFVTKHTFEAVYSDFQKGDSGSTFPMQIQYKINTGRKIININLKYKKVNFTNSESIPFVIPKKYVQIRY